MQSRYKSGTVQRSTQAATAMWRFPAKSTVENRTGVHGKRADDTEGYRHRALKHKRGRYLVTDGTGFCLEVLPSRKFSGRFVIRFEGRPEKVSLVRCPNLGLKAARCKGTSSRRSWRSFPRSPDEYREAYLCSPGRGRGHEISKRVIAGVADRCASRAVHRYHLHGPVGSQTTLP